jgi:hypothetical protein
MPAGTTPEPHGHAVDDRVVVHDKNPVTGYRYEEGTITGIRSFPGGAVTYEVSVDGGRRKYLHAEDMHQWPVSEDSMRQCQWCEYRMQQTESRHWPGPDAGIFQ